MNLSLKIIENSYFFIIFAITTSKTVFLTETAIDYIDTESIILLKIYELY
jgi:hypothetical protein